MNLKKMTKQQLKEYGESVGIKLDLKHKKDDLINQINQQSNFCTECGQDISKSEDSFCFNCGAKIESGTPDKITTNNSPEIITNNTIISANRATSSNRKDGIMNKLKNFIIHVRVNIIDKIIAKADAKIKERELLSFKAELAREHKDIGDYTDNEVNLILSDKREKIIAKIKDKSLIGLLITLLIGIQLKLKTPLKLQRHFQLVGKLKTNLNLAASFTIQNT